MVSDISYGALTTNFAEACLAVYSLILALLPLTWASTCDGEIVIELPALHGKAG